MSSTVVPWKVQAHHPRRIISAERIVEASTAEVAIKRFRALAVETRKGNVEADWEVEAVRITDLPVLPPEYREPEEEGAG